MDNNVIIITAVFPPEPVVSSRMSFDIAESLSSTSNVTVLSPRPSRPYGFNFQPYIKSMEYDHVCLKSFVSPGPLIIGRLLESVSYGLSCIRYLKKYRMNISFIYANTWPMFSQLIVTNYAHLKGIPIIIHIQDIYPESFSNKLPSIIRPIFNNIFMHMEKYIFNKASRIISISNDSKAYLIQSRRVNAKKISAVNNWQNEEAYLKFHRDDSRAIHPNGMFTCMYLGNIGPVADLESIIKSFGVSALRGTRLIIAGSGSSKKKLQIVASDYYPYPIEFIDVPDNQVPETQDLADVLILPIRRGAALSSIPSKLPGYMFSQKPILAVLDNESVTAKVIIESNCGWLVNPGEEDELIMTLKMIVSLSKVELEALGSNGFRYAMSNYSRKINLGLLTKIFMEYTKK